MSIPLRKPHQNNASEAIELVYDSSFMAQKYLEAKDLLDNCNENPEKIHAAIEALDAAMITHAYGEGDPDWFKLDGLSARDKQITALGVINLQRSRAYRLLGDDARAKKYKRRGLEAIAKSLNSQLKQLEQEY